MNHPFLDKGPFYEWSNVQEYWPQRLIHIPTMKSIPKGDSNIYGNGDIKAQEPEYATLSYTWGRWRIKDATVAAKHPTLPVQETPWQIPAVQEEHFTVASFQTIIDNIHKNGVDWAWIDIGCIDQDRSDSNTQAAIEIGRQASIFKRAKHNFVWLSRLDNEKLSSAVDDIQKYGLRLDSYVHQPPVEVDLDDTLENLQKAYGYMFSDPWFSSLWTLQEVVLRNDAIVLSTEGEPVLWHEEPTKQYMYLTMFISHSQNVYDDLERVEARRIGRKVEPLSEKMKNAIKCIREGILHAGFYYLFSTNPNVQYGTAQYRETTRPEDRIYAIMQVYGIRVGKSARPSTNPTLEELVPEFAAAINGRSAIMGQSFVHTETPNEGATWQITEKSTVPKSLLLCRDTNDQATFKIDKDGHMVATGECCRFPDLLQAIKKSAGMNPRFVGEKLDSKFEVLLDSHIHPSPLAGIHYLIDTRYKADSSATHIYQEELWVLRLGNIRGSFAGNGQTNYTHIALLIKLKGDQGDEKNLQGSRCERLGLCVWESEESWPNALVDAHQWRNVNRLLLL